MDRITEGSLTIESPLNDDAPQQNPWRDDRIGFKPFAERLSTVIRRIAAPNGYVFGLQGPWGSGKSTAINFVRAFLEKYNVENESAPDRIEIVEFKPWMFSGHQDLVRAFFQVFTEKKLGGHRPSWFKNKLRVVGYGVDPLIEAFATVAAVVDPTGGIASKTAGKIAGKSLNATIERYLADPSLQTAYDKLYSLLENSKTRYLVIIDDIDRLEREEVRAMMQMVKTVGRLPNIVYLLAYDRDIVWRALDETALHTAGRPGFAEKIVQHEIELPQPFQDDLLLLLESEIAFLLKGMPNNERWQGLVRDGIRRWIKRPRDAHRLANAVRFSWTALEGEIDIHDFLMMEGMRLFDELAFNFVRENRDWLFSEGRYLASNFDERKKAAASLEKSLPEQSREDTLSILSVLFPQRSKEFCDLAWSENFSDTVRRRGIGCPAGFDAYFTLYPSPNEVTLRSVNDFVSVLNDSTSLKAIIDNYIVKTDRKQKTMVGRLLEEISFRFIGKDPLVPTDELLQALFDVGPQITAIDWEVGTLQASPSSAWNILLARCLQTMGPDNSGKALIKCLGVPRSLSLYASVLVQRGRELRAIPGNSSSSPSIDLPTLQTLAAILLPRIRVAATDGTLASSDRPWDIVRIWKLATDAKEPQQWIAENMLSDAQFAAKMTESFVSYTIGSEPRQYHMTDRPDPELYPLAMISESVHKHMTHPKLSVNDRNRMQVVAQRVNEQIARDAELAQSVDSSGNSETTANSK